MSAIRYTSEKSFSVEQVEKLFLSVGWVSGQYPQRLHRALMAFEARACVPGRLFAPLARYSPI